MKPDTSVTTKTTARTISRFMLPAMLVLLAACGGEIVSGPNLVAGPGVSVETGVFSLAAPDGTTTDTEFSVAPVIESGGPVTVSLTSGPCEPLDEARWVANDVGTCIFRGVQETTEDIAAAEPLSVSVVVEPPDLAQGSYLVLAPGSIRVDQRFDVAVSDRIGGPVAVTLTDGPCRSHVDGGFVGADEGTCSFLAAQEDSDSHSAGPDVVRKVFVLSAKSVDIGSFTVAANSLARVGEPFSVEISGVVGGAVTVRSATPMCREAPAGQTKPGITAFWFVSDEPSSCLFVASQQDTTTMKGAPGQRVTVVVERAVGSYTIQAPPAVQIGEPIVVQVLDLVGGAVAINPISGDCTGGAGKYSATGGTICVFEAVQRETNTHSAGQDRQVQVVVEKLTGSFEFTVTPGTVEVGDQVTVSLTRITGGDVSFQFLGGPCTIGISSSLLDFYDTNQTGTCRWQASQEDTPTHTAADPVDRIVVVQPAPLPLGQMALAAPVASDYGQNFAVSVDRIAGGSVFYSLLSGPCDEEYTGYWLPNDDGICVFQAVQNDDDPTHRPADPITRQVRIDPLVGSFDLTGSTSVYAYGSFSVDPFDVSGGDVTVFLLSGPCTAEAAANSFYADNPGTCQFQAVQSDLAGYTTASPQPWTVDVSP